MKKPHLERLLVASLSLFLVAAAPNVSQIQEEFLKGNYDRGLEYVNLLASQSKDPHPDLLYWRGLAQLKLRQVDEAIQTFESALKKDPSRKTRGNLRLGLGDALMVKGDYAKAAWVYQSVSDENPNHDKILSAWLGLGRAHLKQGNWSEARLNLEKLVRGHEGSFETAIAYELIEGGMHFCVQVGSFANKETAERLVRRLKKQGFSPYMTFVDRKNNSFWRVRVGRLNTRVEVVTLEKKLRGQGFDTAIRP